MSVQYSMGTITITETITGPAGEQQVSFVVDSTGIRVMMPSKPSYDNTFVSWANLNDVESLAEIFADWTVREFKVVVPMLGKIYDTQEIFTEL